MRLFVLPLFLIVTLSWFPSARLGAAETGGMKAPTVAVLANRDDPDSLTLAHYYAKRRGLPESSIIALSMPYSEQITWDEFVLRIWNPLLRTAVERGWVLASLGEETDPIGRTKILSAGHRLDALVVCRGVPLRINHDPNRRDTAANPLAAANNLNHNRAAVDSELALLAWVNPPVASIVPNPLYNQDSPTSVALEQVIPVGRLDGPTLDDAKALVDNALLAERDGIAGRAYIDIGGPHRQGDLWLEECVTELEALGFETEVNKAKSTLNEAARLDAPIFYFGWYASHVNGPFRAKDFRFPPGAIALHIHSFSASTLRNPTSGWVGPLVAHGVTATFGNVAEPYLGMTHQPHLLVRALARGEPLGRAALYSLNALSWQAIVVGDPLYRPFAVSADQQWENRSRLSAETETYARIRRMRLLGSAGRRDEASALGTAGMLRAPSLPLALAVADMQRAGGDDAAARRTLGVFTGLKKFRAADRTLALQAARRLHALGESAAALKIGRRLLDDDSLTRDLRVAALLAGSEFARATGDTPQAAAWATEHATLTAPPPPPAPKKP